MFYICGATIDYKGYKITIMESTTTPGRIGGYLRNHWFKLLMFVLIVFVFFKKDFSFSVNFNSPDNIENNRFQRKEEVQQKKPLKKSAPMTAKEEAPKATAMFELLDWPSISKKGSASASKEPEFASIDDATIKAYIERFSNVAINEQKKYGVPASIIIANALAHSAAGSRDMAVRGNNHFALPCTDNWKGESGTYNDVCYRHYENAWTSFRDHSLYLTTGSTSHLVELGPTNYKAWARAMEKLSIFELDNLASNLTELIEDYDLHRIAK